MRTAFWSKCFGTSAFTAAFFVFYVYLLRHPAHAVTVMPLTAVDRLIPVLTWTLPIYLTLWVYVSLPAILLESRTALVDYGARIGVLCLIGLLLFYFFPTATPPANIDWTLYPGMAFLKNADAAGNACPSMHVASAVFSARALDLRVRALALPRSLRIGNVLWCTAIAGSTISTRQHVFVDVAAGAALGLAIALVVLEREAMLRPLPAAR